MRSANQESLQRYEYKYLIPPRLMDPICSFLRPYCEMDPYSACEPDQFYTVRTLYLDSPDYRTYWDTKADRPNRFKLRIRGYGKESDGPVKFEIKRRFNDVFVKTSVQTADPCWPEWVRQPADRPGPGEGHPDAASLEQFLSLSQFLGAAPKVLVKYERQAFRSRIDGYVRISFDRRICHQPQSFYRLDGRSPGWRFNDGPDSLGEPAPRLILELKFSRGVPAWLIDLVQHFGLVRSGFSKYCTAVTRMSTSPELAEVRALSQT